jgi:hypothetical protein
MWWEHFKSVQPAGHEVTWTEFKKAFNDHHIPKGLMVRKMKELLALKQGDDTVVGNSHKGPLNNQGEPTYLRKKQTQTNLNRRVR